MLFYRLLIIVLVLLVMIMVSGWKLIGLVWFLLKWMSGVMICLCIVVLFVLVIV